MLSIKPNMRKINFKSIQPLKVLALITLVIAMIGAAFFFLIPQTTQEEGVYPTQNFDGSASVIQQVRYSGPDNDQDSRLPVGVVRSVANDVEPILTILLSEFEIPNDQESNINGLWVGNTHALSYLEELGTITLSRVENSQSTKIMQEEVGMSDSQILIDQLLPLSSPSPLLTSTRFLQGINHLSESPRSLASIVWHSYAQTINNLPIFFNLDPGFANWFHYNADGILQTASVSPLQISIEVSDEVYELLNPQEAAQAIKKRGFVLGLEPFAHPVFDLSNIKLADVSKPTLEYRYFDGQPLILPYYRFSAIMTTEDGDELKGEILVPALKNPPPATTDTTNQP